MKFILRSVKKYYLEQNTPRVSYIIYDITKRIHGKEIVFTIEYKENKVAFTFVVLFSGIRVSILKQVF